MVSERAAFLFFAAIAVAGAVNVVTRRNPVHAALWLVASFLGVAGLFLTLGSGLLGAIQVLVYAGAIMVLFLFVILLLNLETPPFEGLSIARGASLLAALAATSLLVWPLVRAPELRHAAKDSALDLAATPGNVAALLFTRYALPFEIVSLLLLVAMVGAIHLARRPRRGEPT
jgi:NADH-quinone oxidoreductase subunit J